MNRARLEHMSKHELIDLLMDKQKDIETLGVGIIGTLKAVGVKDFNDLDNLGKQVMKGIPSLLSTSLIMPKLTAKKFEVLTPCLPLIEKYNYLIDKV